MSYVLRTTLFLVIAMGLAPAAPSQTPRHRPELFGKLIDCRAILDNGQRLACFDQAAAAVDAAERNKELVVVDRREIRETKRSLFGFTLPRISLFSDDRDVAVVTRLVNRVVLGLLGGMVALVSVGLLAVPGGPQLTRATSLLDLFGYMGLFLATVLILRVVLAVLRDGAR